MDTTRLNQVIIIICYWCSLGGGTYLNRTVRQAPCINKFECLDGGCVERYDLCNGMTQCKDGSDESPDVCECGRANAALGRVSDNAPGVSDALIESHPWHVGIFRTNQLNNHLKLICSGSLIYNDIVLTSANCIIDPESFQPYAASAIVIGAGKLTKDYTIDEPNQQKSTVTKVVILDGYEGDPKRYAKNLAIIKLKSTLSNSHYVRPVCLWTERDLPYGVRTADITGWGLQYTGNYAINLRKASVNIVDVKECNRRVHLPQFKRYITSDKFCITFDEGVGLKEDDTGGPVTIFDGRRHYLYGVISINLPGSDFGLSTKISKHVNWIRNITYVLKQHDNCVRGSHFNCLSDGTCITLTKVCDGVMDCNDGSDEDEVRCVTTTSFSNPGPRPNGGSAKCEISDGYEIFKVLKCGEPGGCKSAYMAPSYSTYQVTCPPGRGFARIDVQSVEVVCNDGNWFPPIEENRCLRLCPSVSVKSLELKCYYQGNSISCAKRLNPDTKIQISCKRHYKKQPLVNFANETICKKDGSFKHELTECVPVCGKKFNIDAEIQISKGEEVKYAKYPWHAALYWKESSDGDVDYKYKCGGSLIDSNKILTAGHCIWRRNGPMDPDNLAVALGKLHSNWWIKDDLEQKVGVKKVIPGEYYNGLKTKHAQDIAVLILNRDVQLSEYTMPVCLDLDSSAGGIPENQPGHVVGWGSLKDGVAGSSDVLMEAWMDYLSLDSCRKKFEKQGFDEYLYPDKICVLYRNGSGTQTGDSGGGYTFMHDNLHYIYGIVSIKKSGQDIFAAFTNVLSHSAWLKQILKINT